MELRKARLATVGAIAIMGLSAGAAGTAVAGQPGGAAGNECREPTSAMPAELTPGKSIDAGGSPFNPEGHAGTRYAGTGPSAEHANSEHAESQYDIACVNVTRRGVK
jgi:hypothetical protein